MISKEYKQMNYIPTGSLLTQFFIQSKLHCVDQCARLFPSCNIAIFEYSINSQCLLFTEILIPMNLINSINNTVFDFQRNSTDEVISTQQTVTASITTQEPHFIANTYGNLNDNGVNDNRNNYLIFNRNEPVSLSGFVSNVSIKFCSLPISTAPVLWIYIVTFTGTEPYFISRLMYPVPFNQISLNDTIQHYTIPYYQLNITASEYVGIGFGKTTGGSPCRVITGNSSYTNGYGGANQTYLVSYQASSGFTTQTRAVSISFTVLTPT